MTFVGLGSQRHTYFDHDYNATRTNERAVEIPTAFAFMGVHTGPGLEVGDVLHNYTPFGDWTVVDTYAIYSTGVINMDILNYYPTGRFDWIISISTVEHIGWDPPEEKDEGKSLRAIQHMREMLSPSGEMLLTFPTGVHPSLDAAVANGTLNPIDQVFMLRVDKQQGRSEGIWEPRPFQPVPYDHERWSAGGVWMGVLGPT